ncbi:EamA family transporter, partial [Azotobacter beijerinckii]|nr:EamA family transporter [Azotobacter beijerinckii]
MTARTLLLTALAMLAFAGNSLLCRLALRDTGIDAASFTAVRLLAGALALGLLLRTRQQGRVGGSWSGAVALFVYAAGFSFAYLQLDTGVGALLLFGAVQLGMLLYGLSRGERLGPWASLGLLLALAGLVTLLLPG